MGVGASGWVGGLVFPAALTVLGAHWGGSSNGPGMGLLAVSIAFAAAALAWAPRVGAHLLLLAAFFLGAAGSARQERTSDALPEDTELLLEGRLLAAEDISPETQRLTLAVARLPEVARIVRAKVRIWARAPGPRLHGGQTVRLRATLRSLAGPENPGEYDNTDAPRRRGVQYVASAERAKIAVLSPAPWTSAWREHIHASLAARAHAVAPSPDAAALVLTLAAGQRAELGARWEEDFARSGLAHLLSVSGLHVAALALGVLWVLRRLLVRLPAARTHDMRRIAALAAIPWVWGYVFFTGWQPPAVRSAVMTSVVFLGWALWRSSQPLNALALAALVLVAWDPGAVADLSLQLSFVAIAALLLLAPKLQLSWMNRQPRPLRALLQTAAASVAVTLASLPLAAAAFHRISLAGVWTNIVALPLSAALTVCSAGAALAHGVSIHVGDGLLWAAGWMSEGMLLLVKWSASSPAAALALPGLSWPAAAAYFLGLAAWVSDFARIRNAVWLTPLSLLWTLLRHAPSGVTVTFLSVGHGDAIVIASQGRTALVDGGGAFDQSVGAKHVIPFLRQAQVQKLDLAVLSHPHADHALGLAEVLRAVPPVELWLPAGSDGERLSHTVIDSASEARVRWVDERTPVARVGEAELRVLGPPRDQLLLEGVNDRSVVLEVRHEDVRILLTGDIEAPAEFQLPLEPVTVLKVPHHGSRTSSSEQLFQKTRPKYAIFCVSRQGRFHLPAPDIEARYREWGAHCLRTDVEGAISVHSDGRNVQLSTHRRGVIGAAR
ncbi:MAG: DNA internalization-related competence protein ComEC/Rec2 [Myxococcaceae bacterium]